MSKVEVFEPALCCNRRLRRGRGPGAGDFSADLDFFKQRGGDIAGYNLANEPAVFVQNPMVTNFLTAAGSDGLPLVLVDGVTVITGRYPTRAMLARWAGSPRPNRQEPHACHGHLPGLLRRLHAAAAAKTAALMRFLNAPTRFLFFTGKGGVGKTSIACATAFSWPRRQAGAAGEYRPGLQRGPGVRPEDRQHHHPRDIGSRAGCSGDRSRTGRRRLPGADHRLRAGLAACQGDRLDHRTTLRFVHHRNRLVQRVHRTAGRPRPFCRLRPRACSTPPPPGTPSGS